MDSTCERCAQSVRRLTAIGFSRTVQQLNVYNPISILLPDMTENGKTDQSSLNLIQALEANFGVQIHQVARDFWNEDTGKTNHGPL